MDNTFSINVGQIVKSKVGRDAGRIFLVFKVIDDDYLYLVDGSLRKLDNPKKKKIKHLIIYKDIVNIDVENLNDSFLRKALKPYN
ncbi:KOW domain-containing protein [Peptoniphilus stercorisuis]|uniref:Ribosomal protein L14E/L6E/L27E n=1 Tax=Peptoniphilus stercorisuis TaxID=1436965 RepID=A0ABS4KAX7_9FIRM|nr:KOW domain-containing protein [Peptoniphilus stercorisuis]MBP2024929.1 ribosomal protein L14E/L6E/L27E [Peptoniphilus stercorisuis]